MKLFVHWILSAIGILLTAYFIPGFTVESFAAALVASVILGILNILVWPVLMIVTLPFTIVTFGFFLFVVNAVVLKFGAALVPGFSIEGFLPAVLGAVFLTAIGWLVKLLFKDNSKSPV